MKSLRGRLLLAAGSTIAVCWVVALSALGLWLCRSQGSSIVDEELGTVAVRILLARQQLPAAAPGADAGAPPGLAELQGALLHTDHGLRPEMLAVQVWSGRTTLVARTPGAPAAALRPGFAEGFESTVLQGQEWRVHSVPDRRSGIDVQVGIRQTTIDAEVRRRTLTVLGAATVLLMLVSTFMWCALRRAMLPVADMEAALHRRHTFDLTPLPLTGLPTELHPLVGAFNHVLTQLDEAVEGERRFIGDAAHELRTPLAALMAQAQVALRATTAADKDAALRKLLAVAERSTRLSDQLLDLARLNAGANAPQQSPADLAELATYVTSEFDMQAQQQQRRLQLDLGQPCTIVCNVDEIGILLRNLVDNALRYTAPGGQVRIACGPVLPAPSGDRAAASPPAQVFLEVADDGPGVPASEHAAIFERFHRVPGSTVRGSGIGLSLVAGIARLHGATITTGPGLLGRGLSVQLLFPAAPGDRAGAGAPIAPLL